MRAPVSPPELARYNGGLSQTGVILNKPSSFLCLWWPEPGLCGRPGP